MKEDIQTHHDVRNQPEVFDSKVEFPSLTVLRMLFIGVIFYATLGVTQHIWVPILETLLRESVPDYQMRRSIYVLIQTGMFLLASGYSGAQVIKYLEST